MKRFQKTGRNTQRTGKYEIILNFFHIINQRVKRLGIKKLRKYLRDNVGISIFAV